MRAFISQWIGKRIIKTGLAALITAWICLSLHFPALFAVITAIVSVEPTAVDSIKKALIRLPAAAIGAGFAMIFEAIFGEAALTYALAATLTVFVCHRLRLDAGITVATLTAVAMIPETHGHYMDSYLIRLATTLIGIAVAAIINYSVLPPNFYSKIVKSVPRLCGEAGICLERILSGIESRKKPLSLPYERLSKDLERTIRLMHFQRKEWKIHRRSLHKLRRFHRLEKGLNLLQRTAIHIGNLQYLNPSKLQLSQQEKEIVTETGTSIARALKHMEIQLPPEHHDKVNRLDELFHQWEEADNHQTTRNSHHFSEKTALGYELLTLHDMLEELQKLLCYSEKERGNEA
ncbi:MAG TPA: aromatic acid exporter family protein [Bacillales bacterium]|nr:aromatic acid exporter family protein [Bacillales bacterium]